MTTTIRHLTVESFGMVRLVETDLGDGLTLVAGKNGSGKSSLLAAVRTLINGRDGAPPVTVLRGADKATARAVLSDGSSIEVSETAGGTFTLRLRDEKGHLIPSPAAELKRLRGWSGLDPVAMAFEKDPKKVRDILLSALGVDTAAIDREEASLRETRRACGVEGKALAGALEKAPRHDDAPAAEERIVDLLAEVSAAEDQKRANDDARRRIAAAEEMAQVTRTAAEAALQAVAAVESVADPEADPDVAELERQLAEARAVCARNAEQRRRAAESLRRSEEAAVARDRAVAAAKAASEAAEAARAVVVPADPDIPALRARVVGAEEANRKVRENAKRADLEAQLAASRENYRALSEQITAVAGKRAEALKAAGLNIAGLEVSENGVLLNGLPWVAGSTGERLRAAIEVRCASNPPLAVAWTERGDALDEDNLQFVRGLCEEKGLQLLMERTGTRDEGALVLVDGELAGARAEEAVGS